MSGSSAGESSPGAAGGPEERPASYEGGQLAADTGDTLGDTGETSAETGGESDNQGGDGLDTGGDTGDTPGDSSQTGEESSPAAGPGPGKRTDGGLPVVVAPIPEGQRHRNYDWPRIKARYVEGIPDRDGGITIWPTLGDVAAHFQLPPARIREKAAIEGWVEERNKYQAQVEATRRQARAAAMSKEATNLDGRALNAAQAGLQLCTIRLADLTRRAQASRADNAGDPTAMIAIDAQEMQRLAQAVDLFHKIGLRAVGDPETHRLEITGANGRPIEIAQELKRDDPARLTGVLAVLRQAGLGDLFGGGGEPGGAALGDGEADGGEPAALPRG